MRVLYVDRHGKAGTLDEPRLDTTSERHLVALPPPSLLAGDPIAALGSDAALGVVVEMTAGSPSRSQIRLLTRALRQRRRAWVFWPEEEIGRAHV